MKKKILIVTDSLGLARPEPEVTFFEDTYAYMLKSEYEVYQYSVGYARISDLDNACLAYLCQFKPDIVILQAGIVDCAPRAFKWIEEQIFEHYRLFRRFRNLLSKTITTRKLRAKRQVVYTPINHFRACCAEIADTFKQSKMLSIGILPASEGYENVNPGIKRNIAAYNQVLFEVFGEGYISMIDIPDTCIMSDFHHLNAEGHKYVYEQLIKRIHQL